MEIIEDKPVDLTFEEFCQGGKSITPGPWEASQAIRQGYAVYSKDGVIVGCEDEEGRYGAVRYAADARLIAAAPNMLAALKRQQANIRRWLETGEPATTEESKSISDEIDAAIYAAEGKNT